MDCELWELQLSCMLMNSSEGHSPTVSFRYNCSGHRSDLGGSRQGSNGMESQNLRLV